jgi:hypothetical protein
MLELPTNRRVSFSGGESASLASKAAMLDSHFRGGLSDPSCAEALRETVRREARRSRGEIISQQGKSNIVDSSTLE